MNLTLTPNGRLIVKREGRGFFYGEDAYPRYYFDLYEYGETLTLIDTIKLDGGAIGGASTPLAVHPTGRIWGGLDYRNALADPNTFRQSYSDDGGSTWSHIPVPSGAKISMVDDSRGAVRFDGFGRLHRMEDAVLTIWEWDAGLGYWTKSYTAPTLPVGGFPRGLVWLDTLWAMGAGTSGRSAWFAHRMGNNPAFTQAFSNLETSWFTRQIAFTSVLSAGNGRFLYFGAESFGFSSDINIIVGASVMGANRTTWTHHEFEVILTTTETRPSHWQDVVMTPAGEYVCVYWDRYNSLPATSFDPNPTSAEYRIMRCSSLGPTGTGTWNHLYTF